jgi:hypothetical protein
MWPNAACVMPARLQAPCALVMECLVVVQLGDATTSLCSSARTQAAIAFGETASAIKQAKYWYRLTIPCSS